MLTNPLLHFNTESSVYLSRPLKDYKMVQLRIRALVLLLDYGLFTLLIYGTTEFIDLFINDIPNSILYTLYIFYSIIFIAIEYYFDGTIFKVLFNMRSMSINCKKLGLHIYILKFLLLRPIAFIAALIYLNFCTAIILWLFGIQKMLFRFTSGEMDSVWYDNYINQIVTKTPVQNG